MITVRISGTYAQAFTCDRLTSGMVGLPVHFEFSQEWDGLIKNAVFRGSHELRTVLNITDHAVVPWECLTLPGTALEIGVEGRSGDGQLVIPTIYATAGRISVGADDNAEIAQEATPTALEQILAAVEAANEKVPDEGEIDYVLTKTENGNAWLPAHGGGQTDIGLSVVNGMINVTFEEEEDG